MVRLFGLKNCDSCRAARKWLDERGQVYEFIDIRAAQHTAEIVGMIADQHVWQTFVNKRSTTWRKLPEADRATLNEESALALLRAHPTLIKRPAIDIDGQLMAGFDATGLGNALD